MGPQSSSKKLLDDNNQAEVDTDLVIGGELSIF